ncbi:MAG: alpha-galactosidase [Armatimonadota bacterium]
MVDSIRAGKLVLEIGNSGTLFTVSNVDVSDCSYIITSPEFEIDNNSIGGFTYTGTSSMRATRNGGEECVLSYGSIALEGLKLDVVVRTFPGSPFIRFKYKLSSDTQVMLTKSSGQDAIRYLSARGWSRDTVQLTEVQLSHFDTVAHSYLPDEVTFGPQDIYDGQNFAGPVAVLHDQDVSLLIAYEHGADYPNSFLKYSLDLGSAPDLTLSATEGNYYTGMVVDSSHFFESVWFELGVVPGSREALWQRYRQFFLNEISENTESRKPYIFYNTWNYQERNRYYNGRPYLESMNLEHILAEIEVAHKIGIDVFVIDTGWYNKTGDWLVNLKRFPDALQDVKRKLDEYNMRLGLWFNPIVAARTSKVFSEHPEYAICINGTPWYWGEIWETEESYGMCLASGYADSFIETMVRLRDELGVTYFKWDGVSQFGCDSHLHDHGTSVNSVEERKACYAYEMGRSMIRIVDEVTNRRPDVIVDFDITEWQRFMGLGFLSVGKYFLVNNGPYYHDFDIPPTIKIDPNTINVFFHPGAARPRVCRQGIKFDKFIPSILFLTHYLPDTPALSQMNSLTSMMLGGNGIWGDLLSLSSEDIDLLVEHISNYKQTADAVTRSYPRTSGFPGSSPEIYEKLDPESASGMVAFFTVTDGEITHVTQPIDTDKLRTVIGADSWEALPDGRIKLVLRLEKQGARSVFFLGQ